MNENRINELSDEMLDKVTGGADCRFNKQTGRWDVYASDGRLIAADLTERAAKRMTEFISGVEEETGNPF